MLTNRQRALLNFIDQSIRNGISPSFDEMKTELGLKSPSSVFWLLDCLQERGFISRKHYQMRTIKILKMPMRMLVVGSDGNMEQAGHVVVTYHN